MSTNNILFPQLATTSCKTKPLPQ